MARILFALFMTCLLLSILSSGVSRGRAISQFTHTAWTAKDGIPGPVRAIAQTQDGYLWLGTEAGLYRFDGLQFVLWEPAGGEHLSGVSVWSLHSAQDGSLWIGFGTGGVSRLSQGHLTSYLPSDGVPHGGILSIVSDHSGNVWIAGQYGFSHFFHGAWHRIGGRQGYPAPAAQSLLVDHGGTLWVATDGSNFHLSRDPTRPNTVLFLAPNAERFSPTGIGFGQVKQMTEAPDGSVWAADANGHAARRLSGSSRGDSIHVADDEVTCLLFGSDQSLWMGLIERGIRRILNVTNVTENRTAPLGRFQPADGLSNGEINSVLQDREGNIWFGTAGGLDRFREDKFTTYSAGEGLIPERQIAVTSTPDDSVWMISYARDSIHRFHDNRLTGNTLARYSPVDTTRILSLYAETDGSVWLGGSFGLAHGTNGRFTFVHDPGLLPLAMIEAITKDASGHLWVTASNARMAGAVFRLTGHTWTNLRATSDLPHFRCRVLYSDRSGRVWLGFESGEVALFENNGFHVYSEKDGLPGGRVLTITSDHSGDIWIGGEGGLSHFEAGHFTTLTRGNGLPGNSVAAVIEDDEGLLWIAGGLGIFRVAPPELQKALHSNGYRMEGLSLDASDGLRGMPRQREPFPTATRAADGRIWFATTEGVAVIDPRNMLKNPLPPEVIIEEVKADDQTLPPSAGLQLRSRTRNLQFKFAALSLTAPERVKFRYRLEGFDDDWRGPVSTRQAAYTNLPPRTYRFRVIACNNDGVWNEEGAVLDFAIAPAYYQTNWFRALCAAAFLALLWAAYQLRVQQLRHQEKKLRDVVETMPTFAWSALPDGAVDFVNRYWQEYTGLSTEQTVGSGWQAAVHPADLNRHAEKWRASVARGELFENEVRYRRAADGQYRWFLIRAVPLRDARGKIVKWYGVSTDIEDRKRAEQERETLRADLAHVNRVSMMGELAASISHELKQPIVAAMTNARTSLRWLKRDRPDLEEACDAIDRIVKDGTRANEIIDRLRSLYKKVPPQQELVDVNDIIREMVVLLRGEANRYAVSMRMDLPFDLPKITGDPVQLQQVLMNLMLNAIEAMKETGGVLTVKSQMEDCRVLISVSDTGVGLPSDKTDQIFNAFFTTKPQGSGMGLAISRSIVESHGGRLWATDNDGRGATFHFALPTAAEAAQTPATGT
jgi:PAS domain S-box-containing protein